MSNFDLCLLVVMFVLDRLTLGVGEESLIGPHLGVEDTNNDDYKQDTEANTRPHGFVVVSGSVLDLLQDTRLVVDLVLHVLRILQQDTRHVLLALAYWTGIRGGLKVWI